MHQDITPPIDDTYTAYSQSADAINSWHRENKRAGNLAVSSQVICPILITSFVIIFFYYIIELKPHNVGKKIQNELTHDSSGIRAAAHAKLSTYVTISFIFHILTLVADIFAIKNYSSLPSEVKKYQDSNPKRFWTVPIIMFTFDILTLVFFATVPCVMSRKQGKKYRLTYCMIAPLSCIASHSYHIIFAFIHDPYHATSILLLYAFVIFLLIQGFEKTYYYMHHFALTSKTSKTENETQRSDSHMVRKIYEWLCDKVRNSIVKHMTVWSIIVYIIEFAFVGVTIGLSLSLLIILPITNAIDEAPNRLYVIYQASITFFAALIAFQLLFRQTDSILGVFIKAINSIHDDELNKNNCSSVELKDLCEKPSKIDWTEMSENEKEVYLAKQLLLNLTPNLNLKKDTDSAIPDGDSQPRSQEGSQPSRQEGSQPSRQEGSQPSPQEGSQPSPQEGSQPYSLCSCFKTDTRKGYQRL